MAYFGDSLHAFAVKGIPLIEMGQDIVEPVIHALDDMNETLQENDIVIITSKIVSKAENRLVDLREIEPSERAKEIGKRVNRDPRIVEVILQQGNLLGFGPRNILIETSFGFILENAGVDASNISGVNNENLVMLLPKNPNKSAAYIRQRFIEYYKTNVGVLIQDSSRRAWRKGLIGLCIGSSGIKMLDVVSNDPIRKSDLYGIPTQVSSINIGDQISSTGNLLMGEAAEGMPVIIIRGLNLVDETETSHTLNSRARTLLENNEIEKSSIFVETSHNSFYRKT